MEGLLQQGMAPAPQSVPVDPAQDPQGDDQALALAKDWVGKKLFQEGMDEKIYKSVAGQPRPERALAELAYKLVQAADTATEGNVAEEDLVELTIFVLQQVIEIAQTSGAKIDDAMISRIFKQLVDIFVTDHGLDSKMINQAMSQVSDNDFAQYAQSIQ